MLVRDVVRECLEVISLAELRRRTKNTGIWGEIFRESVFQHSAQGRSKFFSNPVPHIPSAYSFKLSNGVGARSPKLVVVFDCTKNLDGTLKLSALMNYEGEEVVLYSTQFKLG